MIRGISNTERCKAINRAIAVGFRINEFPLMVPNQDCISTSTQEKDESTICGFSFSCVSNFCPESNCLQVCDALFKVVLHSERNFL